MAHVVHSARRPWGEGELQWAVTESKSVREVAERLGRTQAAVYSRAHSEGISLRHFMPKRKMPKNEYSRVYYKRTKHVRDAYCRAWRNQARKDLLIQHGGKCVHCGIDNLDVLDFDHINNDGHKDSRKNIIFLVKQDPSRFQVLCKNCNWLKELTRRRNAKQV
jgi:hypothetical protein